MNNQQDRPSIPVTDRTPRPGDFPLGSPASRAAARALLERQGGDDEIEFTVRMSLIDPPVVEEVRYLASGRTLVREGLRQANGEIAWDTPFQKPDPTKPSRWSVALDAAYAELVEQGIAR